MGAGLVKAAFERYATDIPWRTFSALLYMANTAVDADEHPAYWGGHTRLAKAMFKTDKPTANQLREIRAITSALEQAGAITKTRDGNSMRAADQTALYRINLTAKVRGETPLSSQPTTGVKDPSGVRGVSPLPGQVPNTPPRRDLQEEIKEKETGGGDPGGRARTPRLDAAFDVPDWRRDRATATEATAYLRADLRATLAQRPRTA